MQHMSLRRPSDGFTLIEVIVTLTVIAIIFSVVMVSFNRVNSRSALTLATETLASDFRAAALKALNAEQFQLQDPGGWGIYTTSGQTEYIVFADLDNDYQYDTNEKYQSVTLSNNIQVESLTYDGLGTTGSHTLVFNAGDAVPYFDGSSIVSFSTLQLASIIFQDQVNGGKMEAAVNEVGMVQVNIISE